jgi:serine-type D-Ala-D-Ala carboxypeptidase/endopeptidase
MTYPKLLEKTLLAPLGMKSTTAELAQNTTHLKRALGYDLVHDDQQYWDFDSLAGAGGIDSNLDNMLKFAQFCLSPIDSPLQPALELTMKPQIKTRGKGAQCLGWILAADGDTYLHNGMTGGFSSFIAFNRKHNIAVCILSSGTSPQISGLGEHLVRCAASGKPANYELKKAFVPTNEQLNKLVGNYELSPGQIFTIKTRNNRLFAKLTGQAYMEVIATSPTEFDYVAVKARLKFTPGKSLTLFQNGLELMAKKTPNTK